MLFNSYIFIFIFLPLTFCGYYGLHRLGSPVLAKTELILMSLWFYGYFNPSYLWIMCSSILVNYILSQFLQKQWKISGKKLQILKNGLLCIGLFFNLGLIFYFKYYDFFVENMNKRAAELGMQNTNFVNTNGLPAANHYSSAYDIALMSRELMKHIDGHTWFTTWQDKIMVGLPESKLNSDLRIQIS